MSCGSLPWVIGKFRRREQLSKVSQDCPLRLKLWEERSALRLRLLTETWILSRRSSRLCKRKLMLSETRMDRENSCEGMQLLAPKTKQINLIFSGSPVPAPASAKVVLDNYPGKSAAVRLSCSLPDYRHSLPLPPSFASVGFEPASLTGGSVTGAETNGCWTG